MIGEYDGAGTLLRRTVHGPGTDEPIVVYEGGSRKWLVADPRGSIIATTDASGTATATNSYGPWGEEGLAMSGRFGYTGQMRLPELGLMHYKARAYSPRYGRFLQPDPIGTNGGLNVYEYAGSDPVNASDPSGLCIIPIDFYQPLLQGYNPGYNGFLPKHFGANFCEASGYGGAPPEPSLPNIIVTGSFSNVPTSAIVPIGNRAQTSVGAASGNTADKPEEVCSLSAPTGNYKASSDVDARFNPVTAQMLSRAFSNLNRQGIVPVITSGYRSPQLQATLKPGPLVITPARISWHQAGAAIDLGPNSNAGNNGGIRDAMTDVGFIWGGYFRTPDVPHFQSQPASTSPSAAMVSACSAAGGN
jgi:RHS repeat-associated protein